MPLNSSEPLVFFLCVYILILMGICLHLFLDFFSVPNLPSRFLQDYCSFTPPNTEGLVNWNIDYLCIHFYLHQQWQLFCKLGYRTLNFLTVYQFLKQHWVFWGEGGWVIIILKYLKSRALTWCRRQSQINHWFYYFIILVSFCFFVFRPYRRSTRGNWKPEKMFGTDLTPFNVVL